MIAWDIMGELFLMTNWHDHRGISLTGQKRSLTIGSKYLILFLSNLKLVFPLSNKAQISNLESGGVRDIWG
jgi:hypothetical protein